LRRDPLELTRRIYSHVEKHPGLNISRLHEDLAITRPTVTKYLELLKWVQKKPRVVERRGRRGARVFEVAQTSDYTIALKYLSRRKKEDIRCPRCGVLVSPNDKNKRTSTKTNRKVNPTLERTSRPKSLPVRRLEGTQTRVLQKIKDSLDRLNEKMEVITELQKHSSKTNAEIPDVLDVMTLLSLPDHLRKTAITICKLEQATAEEVAEQTKRAKTVESSYLNQLVVMGYLKRERRGRKTYFFVEK